MIVLEVSIICLLLPMVSPYYFQSDLYATEADDPGRLGCEVDETACFEIPWQGIS